MRPQPFLSRRHFFRGLLSWLAVFVIAPLPAAGSARELRQRLQTLASRHGLGPVQSPSSARIFNVRQFGARGDGQANDTAAFQAAAAALNRHRGGILYIPEGRYCVGKQQLAGATGKGYAYLAEPVIELKGCNDPVVVIGDKGARLIAAAGLRLGAFDPVGGQPFHPKLPFTNEDFQANAYVMINVHDNSDVRIQGLELDGNLMHLQLGGEWGDSGRQCSANGIVALNNRKLAVKDVHTHHHGQDGIMIGHNGLRPGSPPTPVVLEGVVSEYNARQGLSWIGGIGLTARRCKFNHTGRARFSSEPGAGLDIEAEDSVCRNGTFISCEFLNNVGCGIVADSGDSAYITFDHCAIWGTSNWSAWPAKPFIQFRNCDIHGALVHPFGSGVAPAAATRFQQCRIDDDVHPAYGPAYRASGILLLDFGGSDTRNVMFDGCHITARHGKSFYADHGDIQHPMIIRNTRITHGCALPPDNGDYMCILIDTRLEHVHFQEAFSKTPVVQTEIKTGPTLIGPDVIVDGPHVVLQGPHPMGLIPPGLIP